MAADAEARLAGMMQLHFQAFGRSSNSVWTDVIKVPSGATLANVRIPDMDTLIVLEWPVGIFDSPNTVQWTYLDYIFTLRRV